ncbi:MAG TPA: calcium-binding protein [Solirubrobacterales bacterium]|nr:calcium-binding protein [Solirubrobacterales bacterium]
MGKRSLVALAGGLALLGSGLQASPAAAACGAEEPRIVGNVYYGTSCDDTYRMPRSVTVAHGEGGNDTIYGQRGNDRLFGDAGNDRLYGGIGDDQLKGGPGDDLLSGGFGADSVLDGEAGDDFVRGDATIDNIQNTGGGTDTLSYATGVTPGFPNQGSLFDYAGFPGDENGRGVYIDLEDPGADDGNGFANNGKAPAGGGVDLDLDGASFEIVIGTPFPDFIVGSDHAETIYGGGGTDVILGEGGADELHGGAEGDSCEADSGSTIDCERSDDVVEPRDVGTIAVGRMEPGTEEDAALYLTGSNGADVVTATYSPGAVTFTIGLGSEGGFDSVAVAEGDCESPAVGSAVCGIEGAPDSIVLAGLEGDDALHAANFPARTSVVMLGNDGGDQLTSGATEDALVDGDGPDTVSAGAGDDAVPNNGGGDFLHAGTGEDLFISDAVCNGDLLDGGPDRDNANWAQFDQAVTIDMRAGAAGRVGPGGEAQCPSPELLTELRALEDIEGTSHADVMVGDEANNQLLGRPGADTYFALGGNDSILANSGTPFDDPDPTIDCGEDWDLAQIDFPANGPDAAPAGCEEIEERAPNSFRPPSTPPDPDPEPPAPPTSPPLTSPPPPAQLPSPPAPQGDRTPPRTGIAHRPQRRVFTARRFRRVVFAFRSSERGARFRCKLDRDRFRPCGSRRAYRLRPGRHALRVFAIDRAGNRDPSPAVFRFVVRRVSAHWIQSHRRRGQTR